MKLADLVDASARVAATPKRTAKIAILADLLQRTSADEIPSVIGILLGRPRQGKLGVGWATLGDSERDHTSEATLEIADVDRFLDQLAAAQGSGSQQRRSDVVHQLFSAATHDEQQYLYRMIIGEIRQGANEGVVAEAVARASDRPVADVRRAAMLLGDLGAAARQALTGLPLEDVGLTPLVGVQPMLAATATSIAEALAITGAASVEWKLDGARIQVHRLGGEVRVFTRSLHEISARVPEIVEAAMSLECDAYVLDGEALGLDFDGNPLKFQDSMSVDTSLRPFFFDVLYADGHSLIDRPLAERKLSLASIVPARLRLPTIDTNGEPDVEAAEEFGAAALAAGHEGVMVKALGSAYQAGRRGATWRKVKPVHTLDLVVLAAEWGHGRRQGFLSNLHLGARDEETGGFVMLGKTFKGLTDELLKWQTARLLELESRHTASTVFVHPQLVVEIAFDGIQTSTRYPGGVALRFARVLRYRDDKGAEEADTIATIRLLHAART